MSKKGCNKINARLPKDTEKRWNGFYEKERSPDSNNHRTKEQMLEKFPAIKNDTTPTR
jgi:hypothetical protein